MSRISNDVGNVENSIMGSLVDVINAPFMIVSSLITLFALSPKLTLFSLLIFPMAGAYGGAGLSLLQCLAASWALLP